MWDILHLPAKPLYQPTVNVFTSAIEPKLANVIVRRLNQIAPLENLRHVKRVKKERLEGGKFQLYVILCIALDGEDPLKCMADAVLELVSSYQCVDSLLHQKRSEKSSASYGLRPITLQLSVRWLSGPSKSQVNLLCLPKPSRGFFRQRP